MVHCQILLLGTLTWKYKQHQTRSHLNRIQHRASVHFLILNANTVYEFYKFQEQQLCTWTWWTCSMENSLLKHALNTGMEDNWTINWLFWFEVCNPRSKESSVPPGDWATSKKRKRKSQDIFNYKRETHSVCHWMCYSSKILWLVSKNSNQIK